MDISTNLNRAALWAALFCVLAAALAFFLVNRNAGPVASSVSGTREPLIIETKSGPKTFAIEVARTNDQQALGLMFRTKLPDTEGMLFPHGEPREVTMWMRNTFIPLDMVFIRADGVIHRIEANTEPMSEHIIASNGAVAAVLELAGGAASRLGIAAGDRVLQPVFEGKK